MNFYREEIWNWGNNDVQRLWDQMLTDDDGPYLEMMTGLYSDNQPDYSWNNPFGYKNGTMYYFPLKNMSSVKEANKDAAINLELKNGKALWRCYTTSKLSSCRLILANKGDAVYTAEINPDPVLPFSKEVKIPNGTILEDLTLVLLSPDNEELMRYSPPVKKIFPNLHGIRNRKVHHPFQVPINFFLKGCALNNLLMLPLILNFITMRL
ncbi:MAG: DUF5107 domain-containing protein [Bacteroidales bacterium]|nr:DUF5107 domain-containing protein [Bacteroidales bacterium]